MKRRFVSWIVLVSVLLGLNLTACDKPIIEDSTTKEKQIDKTHTEINMEIIEPDIEEQQILRVNWGSDPPDLDPQTTSDQLSMWILNSVMEGLVRLNPDGTIGTGLAESYTISDDNLTYTFYLRDAYWSDGTPITSHDFRYAWIRALNPTTKSNYAYQFFYIKGAREFNCGEENDASTIGIKSLDDKTLEVTLNNPTPYFLNLTSFVTYMPVQNQTANLFGREYGETADQMVFSGPFIIEQWIKNDKLVLKKNEMYHDADAVRLDGIKGYMIRDNDTILRMYENDELDFINLPPEFINKYLYSNEFKSLPEATTWYLMFNCENKYFSNYKMRLAFALATDAEAYVNVIAQNSGAVAEGLTPPSMTGKGHSFAFDRYSVLPGYDTDYASILFDEALAEIGATREEFSRDVTILSEIGDTWNRRAQFFQSQWKENLGVELFIEQLTFSERLKRYDTKNYEIAYAGWGGDYNDPLTFMDMLVTEGGHNYTHWSNELYDEFILKAVNGIGYDRIDALAEAEVIIAQEIPVYPIYHPNKNLVIKPYVKSLAIFPIGPDYDFKWTYIDK
ncbi:MAG: Oligopeptide ABC transporter, periplasmic oligopeptide-binding protein OppA [Clostridiales bacterium 38_11]|nr:MAG: Oligopeptide ABC transporter, periplasmic oligopeptide-binding protein OppA [Clostridiales bacterium 38_11]HBH12529.1 peptide ABC transporter substrate-binding protein [Clostridiales bacterium]